MSQDIERLKQRLEEVKAEKAKVEAELAVLSPRARALSTDEASPRLTSDGPSPRVKQESVRSPRNDLALLPRELRESRDVIIIKKNQQPSIPSFSPPSLTKHHQGEEPKRSPKSPPMSPRFSSAQKKSWLCFL